MKGNSDRKFSEMRENVADHDDLLVAPECKRMKPDVLLEMGLAMLDDDEPSSAGDTQMMVSMHNSYINSEAGLMSNISEDVSSFVEPYEDDFEMFRRQKSKGLILEDYFSKLSDEIVLSVFRWLPKKTLKRCSLVCRRWRSIAYDEELWTRMDLGGRTIIAGNLADVLKRGVRILRLAQADVPDPVFSLDSFPDDSMFPSRLQFLDLSMAVITERGLASLLQQTRHLIKLSLEHCRLNDAVCDAIAQNPQLEVLNLTMVYNLTPKGLRAIISSCRKLIALNLGWTDPGLNTEALDALMSCLPPNLSQLNISGCRQAFFDRHVSQIVKGCPKLTELDISDCTMISPMSIDTLCKLGNLEHLSISRCYQISSAPSILLKLAIIPSLRYLDLFGFQMSNEDSSKLRRNLPNIEINKFMFSSIARPTVGIRRTSIWGLRVRD